MTMLVNMTGRKKKTNNFYYPNINDLPNLKVFDSARSKSESYF